MTDSRISGALEPRAMSVRLDTVSFHIRTVATDVSPLGIVIVTSFSCRPTHTHRDIRTYFAQLLSNYNFKSRGLLAFVMTVMDVQ